MKLQIFVIFGRLEQIYPTPYSFCADWQLTMQPLNGRKSRSVPLHIWRINQLDAIKLQYCLSLQLIWRCSPNIQISGIYHFCYFSTLYFGDIFFVGRPSVVVIFNMQETSFLWKSWKPAVFAEHIRQKKFQADLCTRRKWSKLYYYNISLQVIWSSLAWMGWWRPSVSFIWHQCLKRLLCSYNACPLQIGKIDSPCQNTRLLYLGI